LIDLSIDGLLASSLVSLIDSLIHILGLYWIDPNGGITNDAIKVYCEFHTNASCLYPGEESQVAYTTWE
jgi:hypothetical protein